MRTRTLFPLALALVAAAVAYACMADPDPGGGHRPATATEAAGCGPADGPLCDLYPEGSRGIAAHHGDDHCKGYGEPQDDDFETCPGIRTPCRGWGMEFDDDAGDCVCRDGLVEGSDGHCDDPDWDKPGLKGDDGDGGGGGGGSGGGRGGNNDDDGDDDALGVSLLCAPDKVERGGRVDCDATARNAQGEVTYTWRFKPENGGVQVWPNGAPEELPFVDDTTETASWSGTVAAGGRVSVPSGD